MKLKNVITDHYFIAHNDSKVVYAKCKLTGRFVKHALVIEHCLFNEVAIFFLISEF